jgi:hypothetical protein
MSLAFKVPINVAKSKHIKLPRSERWIIEYIDHSFIYIGFGRKTKYQRYKYNLKALGEFQKKYPQAKLGVWNFDDKDSDDSSEEEEFYDPKSRSFKTWHEYQSQFPGDSLPYPVVTREQLDRELDEYMSNYQ